MTWPAPSYRPVHKPLPPVELSHVMAREVVTALREFGALLSERDGRGPHVVDSLADCVDLAIEQAARR